MWLTGTSSWRSFAPMDPSITDSCALDSEILGLWAYPSPTLVPWTSRFSDSGLIWTPWVSGAYTPESNGAGAISSVRLTKGHGTNTEATFERDPVPACFEQAVMWPPASFNGQAWAECVERIRGRVNRRERPGDR